MPYRIAFLSKFPPIEGGIASKTFWLARGLAKRGHTVHIITPAISTDDEYRIKGGEEFPRDIPNFWIHRSSGDIPWHIPEDNEQAISLLDTATNVIREFDIQILDTGYLVPYGILGHLAKTLTGISHVLRHGGSDITKFLKGGVFKTLLHEAISNADAVISDIRANNLLELISSHLVYQPAYVADEKAFVPSGEQQPRWRLAAIGKINYYWQHKSLDAVVEIMSQLVPQFECWIVGQGNGLSDLQKSIGEHISSNIRWLPFIPPWEMPSLLSKLDAIFVFESRLPHQVISNLVLEALCSGVGIITDRLDFKDTYQDIFRINSDQVLQISLSETSLFSETITKWIRERTHTDQKQYQLINHQDYLLSTEKVYEQLL